MICTTHLFRHVRRTIGLNIRNRRARRGLTLCQLSRRSMLSSDLLDRYELGKNEITLHDLLKIACALDARVAELMGES